MMKRNPIQLSWESQPFAEIVRLGWPIAISMLSYSTMTLADTLFVGRLGAASLAGVGLGGILAFTAICFSFGLLRSTKVAVAQARGAGHPEQARFYLGSALGIAALLGFITTVLGLAAAPWLPDMAATAEAGVAAESYYRARILGTPIVLTTIALREARYGLGDSRMPMFATVAANIINIILDYLFIFTFDFGVAGAAWATNVGTGVEALLLVAIHARAGSLPKKGTPSHRVTLWRLGWPLGLQFLIEIGAFAVLVAMISKLDEAQMAAHQITLQVIHFAFLPAVAVGDATSVLTGQAVGAFKDHLVVPVSRAAAKIATAYTTLCSVVLVLFGRFIASAFTDNPDLIELTVQLMWVAAVFQLFDGINMVARGALRGTGDMRVPAFLGIAIAWFSTPPLMWILGYEMGLGAFGGWIGLCIEIVVAAGVLWWRLEAGGWRHAAETERRRRESAEQADASSQGA